MERPMRKNVRWIGNLVVEANAYQARTFTSRGRGVFVGR